MGEKNKVNGSDYHTLLQSENTVQKISQPVKIAQLLGSSGRLQNGQNSIIKISLPERLTPYLKNASSQKKNVTNTHMILPHNKQNVRRNLKFTATSISAVKTKRCTKADINNGNDNPKKENSSLFARKSFLLPPNTIKELYIKNEFKQNKSEISQFRILTVNSKEIDSKTSESCSSSVKNEFTRTGDHQDNVEPYIGKDAPGSGYEKNTQMLYLPGLTVGNHEYAQGNTNSVVHVKRDKTPIIQNVSSQMFNVNEQFDIDALHSSYLNLASINHNAVEKISENLNFNQVNICGSQNGDCNVIINTSHLSSVSDANIKIDTDLYDNNADQNNIHCTERHSLTTYILPDIEKVEEASLIKNIETEKYSFTTTNINDQDLHSSLQTVKIMSESCLNLQCSSTNEDEDVTLSKTELTVLASKLKHLICKLEEDVSDLKLTLTIVTKLLSATNMANKGIKDNDETKITHQITEITENLNDNMKVTDFNTRLSCIAIIDKEHDKALKDSCKTLDIDRSKFLETNEKDNPEMQLSDQMYISSGSNKENKELLNSPIVKQCKKLKSDETRRRSARLMTKVLQNSNAANDSFVNLENELDIVNRKSNVPITQLRIPTPAKNKYQDEKIKERPIKEYMALKSRMSCLLTPNIKRFNSSESKNIYQGTDDVKISVSDKLLAELYNLYEDSQ